LEQNMTCHTRIAIGLVAVTVSVAGVRGDVRTREKTQMTFSGMMGTLVNRFGGQNAKDGITSQIAVKAARMASINEVTGQIIDLTEQKVYDLDVKKKQYTVTTFAELKKRIEDAAAKAQQQAQNATPEDKAQMQQTGKEMDFEFDVKETGQRKQLAGYDTREVVMTLTGHAKGQKIEESGGMILTDDLWLAPRIAALDEIAEFRRKYAVALMGDESGVAGPENMQQMAALVASFPAFAQMSARLRTEGTKLDGTPILTTLTFETVKSADAMKAAADQQSQSGGGGIGGMIGRRLVQRGPAQAKTTAFSTTTERLSVDPTATADDVALPAGFKEKK
jgi:hypothetical protein